MTSYSVIEQVLRGFAPKDADPDIVDRQIDHMLEGYISWRVVDGTRVELHGGGSGEAPCYLGVFHDLPQGEMTLAITEALQKWHDAETKKLMKAVLEASRSMEKVKVKSIAIELHKAREVPGGPGTFLGLRIRHTDGPERIMSAPEFGRFVNLEVPE